MKLNYPGSAFEPMTKQYVWTEFHPLAMFNAHSLFHRFRAEVDHAAVFQEYLLAIREDAFFASPGVVEVRNVLDTVRSWRDKAAGHITMAIDRAVDALGELQNALSGPQWAFSLAAAGAVDFVMNAGDPDANNPNSRITLPDSQMFKRGEFCTRAYGLPAGSPCVLFLVDAEAAEQLCEAAGSHGPVSEENLRLAISDPVLRENEDVALILAGVPSAFAAANERGCAEFRVPNIPRGQYGLPRDHWKVVCYAPI